LDSDLYTLDGYDGENFLTPSIKELYSLKYGMQVKGGKVKSFASKRGRKSKTGRGTTLRITSASSLTALGSLPMVFFTVKRLTIRVFRTSVSLY
jgi:hypothetical protein